MSTLFSVAAIEDDSTDDMENTGERSHFALKKQMEKGNCVKCISIVCIIYVFIPLWSQFYENVYIYKAWPLDAFIADTDYTFVYKNMCTDSIIVVFMYELNLCGLFMLFYDYLFYFMICHLRRYGFVSNLVRY